MSTWRRARRPPPARPAPMAAGRVPLDEGAYFGELGLLIAPLPRIHIYQALIRPACSARELSECLESECS